MESQSSLPRHMFSLRLLPHWRSRQATAILEWQVCEDDDEYHAALRPVLPAAVAPVRAHPALPTWAALAVCLLVGGLLSLQLGHTVHAGLAQLEQELALAVEADLWRAARSPGEEALTIHARATESGWQAQTAREASLLQALDVGERLTTTPTLLALGEGWARVQIVTQASPGQPAYRQTRVYAESEGGWVRFAPRPLHWGRPQQWESEYFIFHFYTQDAAAVTAAAALLDARYPALYAAFFLEPPAGPKAVVMVTPEQAPGELVIRAAPDAPFVTASPGIYLTPASVSDGELLAQALVLSLLDDLIQQAAVRYAVPDFWRPLLDGVRLWQVWEAELPLSQWRTALVSLIYTSDPDVEPAFGPEFCAQHRLWMASPLELKVPLICHAHPSTFFLLLWGKVLVPPLDTTMPEAQDTTSALRRLLAGREMMGDDTGTITVTLYPGTTIAVATVLEYAAATYGPETISALLAALAEHDAWETLPPAVFGVTADEFDAGWRAHLLDQLCPDIKNGQCPLR